MRKLLISLFIIGSLLLVAVSLVGKMAEHQTRRLVSKAQQHGLAVELLAYEKQFLSARASTRVTLLLEQEQPLVFTIESHIRHYPYKAQMDNKITFLDAQLTKQVQDYFATENWLNWQQTMSLSGGGSGQLQLLPGAYYQGEQQFASKALELHYQLNVQDDSARVKANWQGVNGWTKDSYFSVEGINFSSHIKLAAGSGEYAYFAELAEVVIQQSSSHSQLQDVKLQSSTFFDRKANTLDSSNDWQVAFYQLDNDPQKVFTDNHLKFNFKGLSAPAVMRLSSSLTKQLQAEKALAELMLHGVSLAHSQLRSTTPWGKVQSAWNISLQRGAEWPEVAANPFMLLDYTSGQGHLLLPAALLQLPDFKELLKSALENGLLQKRRQTLSLEVQLEQGELTLNGRVVPL